MSYFSLKVKENVCDLQTRIIASKNRNGLKLIVSDFKEYCTIRLFIGSISRGLGRGKGPLNIQNVALFTPP